MIAIPEAIRAWLVEEISSRWPDPAPVLAALPAALAPGEVVRLAGGGPFGLLFDARLDVIDGRAALEVLENSRMAGEVYFRVWEDGTREPLEPAPWLEYADGQEQEYFEHNRRAYEHLRARGFFAA